MLIASAERKKERKKVHVSFVYLSSKIVVHTCHEEEIAFICLICKHSVEGDSEICWDEQQRANAEHCQM